MSPPTCAAADARPADAPPDAPPTCATSAGCPAAAPICDTTSLTCRGCVADGECSDGAICIEHLGECVAATNVLFVAPAGVDQGNCTQTSPCATIGYALARVANNQKTIAVADGTYATPLQIKTLGANSLTISGPDRDPAGVTLTAGFVLDAGSKGVLVEGITITNASGRAVDSRGTLTLSRVHATGASTGLVTSNNFTLDVWDSAISGNAAIGVDISQTTVEILRTIVRDNNGGGVSVSNAATTIESSVIADNGGVFAPFGGVRYQNLGGKPQVFRFNTVAGNTSGFPTSAVTCPTTIALESSIFAGDPSFGSSLTSAMCAPTFSLFSVDAPSGTGNLTGDPAFVGAGDYHIGPSSPARDAADPAATTTRDVDNEVRPQGTGRDIGADEIP